MAYRLPSVLGMDVFISGRGTFNVKRNVNGGRLREKGPWEARGRPVACWVGLGCVMTTVVADG